MALKKIRDGMESALLIIVHVIIILSKCILKIFSSIKSAFNHLVIFFKDERRALGEGFFGLVISVIGSLFAGILLGKMTFFLENYPGLIVLIPGAIGMRGNIFGALGSRLSSDLHIGILPPELKKSNILTQNISGAIILTIILSLLLAFFAKGFCIVLGFPSITIIDFTIISVLGGIFSGIMLLPLTIIIALKSYENGWDPDNVTTPIIATIGDLFALPSILIAVLLLGWIKNGFFEIFLFIIFIFMGLAGLILGLRGGTDLKKIIYQSTPVLLICSLMGTTAGSILNSKLSIILSNPSILTMVPLFSAESGDLVSILGARLSSGLHSGYIKPTSWPNEGAIRNFGIMITLAVIIYPLIGLIAHFASLSLGIPSVGLYNMIIISSIAGGILTPIMLITAFYLNSISYRKGFNPDNIVIPLSTSITDPLANLTLIAMTMIFLGISLTQII
jgi:mgtE-like transporter